MAASTGVTPALSESAAQATAWAMDRAREAGVTVSFDVNYRARLWSPEATLQPGAYGILEPVGAAAPPPDIILVPTLGYTRQGDRIGYGKGYYDRTLAALKAQNPTCITIGIAWATGDLSGQGHVPAPHDYRLDSILTDKGWAVPAPILA